MSSRFMSARREKADEKDDHFPDYQSSLLSLYTLDLRRLYPAYLIWGRSVVRLAVAGLLYYLRPREGHTAQS